MRFVANKLGRLLTLGRIFNTQTLKLSPTSKKVLMKKLLLKSNTEGLLLLQLKKHSKQHTHAEIFSKEY